MSPSGVSISPNAVGFCGGGNVDLFVYLHVQVHWRHGAVEPRQELLRLDCLDRIDWFSNWFMRSGGDP